jgi:hypothetical protein
MLLPIGQTIAPQTGNPNTESKINLQSQNVNTSVGSIPTYSVISSLNSQIITSQTGNIITFKADLLGLNITSAVGIITNLQYFEAIGVDQITLSPLIATNQSIGSPLITINKATSSL